MQSRGGDTSHIVYRTLTFSPPVRRLPTAATLRTIRLFREQSGWSSSSLAETFARAHIARMQPRARSHVEPNAVKSLRFTYSKLRYCQSPRARDPQPLGNPCTTTGLVEASTVSG